MNPALQQKSSTRWSRSTLYGMMLFAVAVSLPLGMTIAAAGAWFAIQAGSLVYLPVGLVILLAVLAVVRSRSIADAVLLVLAGIAMIAWWMSGTETRSWMQSSAVELSGRVDLLVGLLVIMLTTLLIVYRYRPPAGPTGAFVR